MNGDTNRSHRKRSRSTTRFIQGLLSKNTDDTPVVFCQLDCLTKNKENEVIWQESARWVKYEEDVEQNGKRWSKPHVSSVTLQNIFELRSQLNVGVLMFDVKINTVRQLADLLLYELSKNSQLDKITKDTVRSILLTRHVHPNLKRSQKSRKPGGPSVIKVQSTIPKTSSTTDFAKVSGEQYLGNDSSCSSGDKIEATPFVKMNKPLMKKIPRGAEVANIWVGEIEEFKEPITAFIRLAEAKVIGDLSEVALPTKFLFLHLTPPGEPGYIFETGRAMSNMMVDAIFSEVAYKCKTREEIMTGVDEFLDQVIVLPPAQWDPEIRIEPPTKVPSQEGRRSSTDCKQEEDDHEDPSLNRTGRLFGGLVQDIKRKLPFYPSDFKDGFHIQSIATILYMYLATITPNITFGALLGQSTEMYMGTMECIVTVAFVGLTWALFSGQPLIIMGSTGPLLVLEVIIFQMCKDNSWNFLQFRLWIGLWAALLLLVIVAFDLSALVRYITRFTEESFACLIALIFIFEAFRELVTEAKTHPFNIHPEIPLDYTCYCVPPNDTYISNMTTVGSINDTFNSTMSTFVNWTSIGKKDCIKFGGVLEGPGCHTPRYDDNVFFLSVILCIGTFFIAWTLVGMKTSRFFPTFVRQILADFAVFLSVCIMVLVDVLIGIHTPKLIVPDTIQPSRNDRGWFIYPYNGDNPWWTTLASALPALVAVILIFMDQQITAVIVNRKEYKLKKGCGYHLDLTVCLVCIVVCSLFGLPWYVAATVRSMSHINSLKMESKCTAPGEKPVFLGCREQRLTGVVIAIMNGCSVFITKVLQLVPMPVLYGVFLYMGVSALKGMQFVDRILIMFMPAKYQPDHMYLRHVRIKRVHIFTLLQIVCLAVLWVIKAIKTISIAFPLMVLGTCFVRKGMEKFFTRNELKWLDELMPEEKMMSQEDAGELIVDDDDEGDDVDEDEETDNEETTNFLASKTDGSHWNKRQDGLQRRNVAVNKFLLGDVEEKADHSV